MAIKLYNTITRKKELFKKNSKEVSYYTCGPTVYDFVHLGNLRTYIVQDVLRRILEYRGFKIHQVVNITDVDDKTILGSQKKNILPQSHRIYWRNAKNNYHFGQKRICL